MLEDTKELFIKQASVLGDYVNISTTDLANGYIRAEKEEDESKKSQYYAALVLRYWHKIFEWMKTSKSSGLEPDDFVSWLYESLDIAFRYRDWTKRKSKLYKDPNGPDKVINRCCFSTRNRYYQYYNKDKRKANYLVNSFDAQVEEYGDSAEVLENSATYNTHFSSVDNVIENLVLRKKYIEALSIYGIVEGDVFKEVKKNVKQKIVNDLGEEVIERKVNLISKFDENKLVKYLTHFTEEEMDDFADKFNINKENKKAIYHKLVSLNGTKLHYCIRKLFKDLKADEKVKKLVNN